MRYPTSTRPRNLEIADMRLRRQFLFQHLIPRHHCLMVTKTAIATSATTRNCLLQIDFPLKLDDTVGATNDYAPEGGAPEEGTEWPCILGEAVLVWEKN